MTLGENIADNGGLRHAYRAFLAKEKQSPTTLRLPGLTKYDNRQMFFISHAVASTRALFEGHPKPIEQWAQLPLLMQNASCRGVSHFVLSTFARVIE